MEMLRRSRTGKRYTFLPLLGALLLTAAFLSEAAIAQVNPFRKNIVHLTDEDLRMMSSAAQELTKPTARAAQMETWSNPKSGNSGSIELLKTFEKNAMLCQKRRYGVHNDKENKKDSFVVDVCRLPNGEWKLD